MPLKSVVETEHFYLRQCIAMAPKIKKASKAVPKTPKPKKLSNPFSTGGGGVNFETRVQASFAVLMLAGGASPCTRTWPIRAIHLQAKHIGIETDDIVVEAREPHATRKSRLLGQIKHDIAFTEKNDTFSEVIAAAWIDFSKNIDRGLDAFALITGPLSGTDLELRTVLEWARTSGTADEFFKKVSLSNFSSANKQAKLKAVLHHLKAANNGVTVNEEEAWSFLKSFHVLQYDLDIAGGVNRAFLTCIISQFGTAGSEGTWARVIEAVRDINQSAGTITVETLPPELVECFRARPEVTISRELLPPQSLSSTTRATNANNPVIAIAQLVGTWSEASRADQEYVSKLAGETYDEFSRKLSVELNMSGTVLRHRSGIWSVTDREECWEVGSSYIFDRHLKLVQQHATRALSQDDNSLLASDVEIENPDSADSYSRQLRSSFADTLALMTTRSAALIHCRSDVVKGIPQAVVSQCLRGGGWLRIASLDRELAVLAEAAPEAFLAEIEGKAREGATIRYLFSLERGGVFARTRTTGLLWGLESLAWSSNFLGRVTLLLGGLDALDTGGQWANRPLESLKSIFLPWHPQTSASLATRTSSLRALGREHPSAAWAVYVAALPGVTQSTSGTHRPKWQDFGEFEAAKLTRKDYFDEINLYTESLLDLAASRPEYLSDLAEHLPNLPPTALIQAIKLIDDNVHALRESGRDERVWTVIRDTARKHTAFANAEWAMPTSSVAAIEALASRLQPDNPTLRYRDRFGVTDPLSYDRESTWQQRREKIESLQKEAVQEIWVVGGLPEVVAFATSVSRPRAVGAALAKLDHASVPLTELQRWAESDSEQLRDLLTGYTEQNFATQDGEWLQALELSQWDPDAAAKVIAALPFSRPTWDFVETLLARKDGLYWKSVAIGFVENKRDAHYVVKKLLANGRPDSAVHVLHSYMFRFGGLDTKDAVKALLALAGTKLIGTVIYEVEGLIKRLQDAGNAKALDLQRIEWAYLDLLVQKERETFAKTLEQRLADEPDFFLEMLGRIYRPNDASPKEPTDQDRRNAAAATRLLLSWRTPPGQKINDGFSEASFHAWLEQFVEKAKVPGYLDVGLSRLGQVLIHGPTDPSGFWINRVIAAALNSAEFDRLRSGYCTGLYNARGAYWVDPTGAPERALAEQYHHQAEAAEQQGFIRLAASVRALAKEYDQEASSVTERFNLDAED